ncbi:MAG: phosphoribosylaminoimidazolesuccinocarboxamide synthase, partial [bacterium]
MTSVKDFLVEEQATRTDTGKGTFLFTDRYSVFDWGEMPDHIPGKGSTLCTMGAYNFEMLEDEGIPTHYRGIDVNGNTVPLAEVDEPPSRMNIELTQVPELPYKNGSYDYESYHSDGAENYLIPLEVIFRNRIPRGSSLRRRKDPSDVGFNYDDWPDEVIRLEEPIVEFSTKYEEKDRYLDRGEAARIAGRADLKNIEDLAHTVNQYLCERAQLSGMTHDDGKIECLYHRGEIKVADVVGTFDENRFTFQGHQLSKEVIRQYYRSNQPAWLEAIDGAREQAKEEQHDDWRMLCDVTPDPLPENVLQS